MDIQSIISQPWQWAILAVLVMILIVTVAVVIGLRNKRKKEISFTPKDEIESKTGSGDYQAQGGFNFQSAGDKKPEKETLLLSGQELPTDTAQPLKQTEPVREQHFTVEETREATVEDIATPQRPTEPESVRHGEHDLAEPAPAPQESEKKDITPEPEKQEETNPAADIAPTKGRLNNLRGRLAKSQNMLGKSVLGMLSAGDLDEDAWEDIEDTLLMADLGVSVTTKVVDTLKERIAREGVAGEAQARALLREVLIEAAQPELDRSINAMPYDGKPGVVLVVGVNGTGKTTTTGKLARVLVADDKDVVLGAADTFRAAAADQLETWGNQVGARTVRGHEGADPASVAFDSVSEGIEDGADVVLIDTAGRLHTSVGLMDQLEKVKRVVEKRAKVDEVILVLDATIGQNGLAQAHIFADVVDITGVALTKLDGTAKGGIVFQVQEELGVPVKLVGLGEGADDLAPFEVDSFIDALLGE